MNRVIYVVGAVLGLIWAVAIVYLPQQLEIPFVMGPVGLALGFIAPGAVTALMIAVIAARRFFSNALIDGTPPKPGSRAARDQAVLSNTIEQLVLALVIWPFVANTLGGALIVVMGLGFALARLLFWAGYHIYPPLRAFGFGATFYPTLLAAIWAVLAWMG